MSTRCVVERSVMGPLVVHFDHARGTADYPGEEQARSPIMIALHQWTVLKYRTRQGVVAHECTHPVMRKALRQVDIELCPRVAARRLECRPRCGRILRRHCIEIT